MPVLTSALLSRFPWVEHGFGTRHDPLDQDSMASLKQIHSNVSLVADRSTGCVGEGDALVTNQSGIAVSIRTADCLPILLADPESHTVAAIHAGWRGTAAEIVSGTLSGMHKNYGTNPTRVHAAIGPGIGVCCYEVGVEVAQKFGYSAARKIDLAAENRRQLIDSGVPASQIDLAGQCTFCNPAHFFSWRREGERAGRMISFIRIR